MEDRRSYTSHLKFHLFNKTPLVLQSEDSECGLACLAMVAGAHGLNTSLVELREKFNFCSGGTSLVDLMKVGEQLNFSCRPLKLEIEDLDKLNQPCILHWNFSHFVVLIKVSKRKITIMDPAKGELELSLKEASNHFTGIALELSPKLGFQKKAAKRALKLTDLWSGINGIKRSLIVIFGLSLLLQLFILVSPYYMQLVVDDVVLTQDVSLLTLLFIGFLFVLLFEGITNALRGISLIFFNSSLNQNLSRNLFSHLVRLPVAFFKNRHMGDVVSRFSSLNFIREFITRGFVEAIIDGFMAILIVMMLFFYSPNLAWIALLSITIYTMVRIILLRPTKMAMDKEIIARAEENSNFMETIKGIQTLKLFNAEVQRENTWDASNTNAINQSIKLGYLKVLNNVLSRLIFGIENLVVIYFASKLVLSGGFSVGMMFAFMTYKSQLTTRTTSLIDKIIEFKILGLHLERISDIALSKTEVLTQGLKNHNVDGSLELRDVSYQYADLEQPVVKGLSLKVSTGECVAITGPSGSGKSTLIKLMLGLIQPSSGLILVDGQNLAKMSITSYRDQIAAVLQDDELFSGTIAENISFFDPIIDMERVIAVAKVACINDTVEQMTMGYQTLISNMGSSLSGGQKQRIVLARALYKKPKIIFMDEATSHLDNELELKINSAISQMKITRIIVAHRNETIRSADRVINLDFKKLENKEVSNEMG